VNVVNPEGLIPVGAEINVARGPVGTLATVSVVEFGRRGRYLRVEILNVRPRFRCGASCDSGRRTCYISVHFGESLGGSWHRSGLERLIATRLGITLMRSLGVNYCVVNIAVLLHYPSPSSFARQTRKRKRNNLNKGSVGYLWMGEPVVAA
jgi:hypothetical protein